MIKNLQISNAIAKADSGGIDTMEQYHHKVRIVRNEKDPVEQTNKMVCYKVELVKMRYMEEGEYFSRLVLKVQEDNLMMAPNRNVQSISCR